MEYSKDEAFMRAAIRLAFQAREDGNHPFGALLVRDDKVVLTAVNSVITENDVTHHAELNLISEASRLFTSTELGEMILYTSTEPCAMCTGAIFWAGVRKVVYGCSAEKLGELAGGSFVVPCRHLFAFGMAETAVVGPILEAEAVNAHLGFWQ